MVGSSRVRELTQDPGITPKVCQITFIVCILLLTLVAGALALSERLLWSDRYVHLDSHCTLTYSNVTHACVASCHRGEQTYTNLACAPDRLRDYHYIDVEDEKLLTYSPDVIVIQTLAGLSLASFLLLFAYLIFIAVRRAKRSRDERASISTLPVNSERTRLLRDDEAGGGQE